MLNKINQAYSKNTIAKTKQKQLATKNGATTFYVVIFTTLLVTVIVTSFIRIILSESTRTINADLSTSAYDSALAGVEDAKIALVRYRKCLDEGYTANATAAVGSCERLIADIKNGIANDSCDTIGTALGRVTSGEVVIQEQSSSGDNNSSAFDQAYTCTKISEQTEDYRATLNSTTNTRLVPLWAADTNNDGNREQVRAVKFSWYTGENTGTYANNTTIPSVSSDKIPAVMVDVYQTDPTFNLAQLSVNNVGTNHSELLLLPGSSTGITTVPASTVLEASNKTVPVNADTSAGHNPVLISCANTLDSAEFRCSSVINFPAPFSGGSTRNTEALALRLSLPFGGTADLAVTLCSTAGCPEGSEIPFDGLQAQVDSTGRANDLFRRVEVRVDLLDSTFPFPEYALQQTGTADLNRTTWVTDNCWTADNGTVTACNNSGSAPAGL
ncbi:MAG: hypothetical protein Q4E46_01075 [Candidatus Saccharibacteria bacterium]|nr:hypothetical protein [Candidatus Saccharibacteria bacterium]